MRKDKRIDSLDNLKLLDSTLKEVQRIKPVALFTMNRIATQDVTLSNGFTIPKGRLVYVDSTSSANAEIYDAPEFFDAYRFSNLRERLDFASKALFVSTSGVHLGFGHGDHACPGRFLAAREIKIALCHLLLKYDWKLAGKSDVTPHVLGTAYVDNPDLSLLFRRREEELEIESVAF
ncbi:hypothetical protein MY11210_009451, partial [Beauveria gryllotalpidicola]